MYQARITALKNVRTFPEADRLKLATCVGSQVVVGLNHEEGELGLYFSSDGQLSHEFCYYNNLYRDSSMNKDKEAKAGMFDNNRRIRAQTFRKQKSDGFWIPMDSVRFTGVNEKELVEGFEFDTLNGVPICNKYVSPETLRMVSQGGGTKIVKTLRSSPMFFELPDTGHLFKNLHTLCDDDLLVISLKCHGTSHRVGHVLINRKLTMVEKIAKFFGANINEKEWTYLSGTRRVVLSETSGKQYNDPSIREKALNLFKDNLFKGETVYLEIVGYENLGRPIMGSVDLSKFNDKKILTKYSNQGSGRMAYTYGCEDGQCDFYIYKITMTNEDGKSIDYSWDDIVKRSEELGVKHVPYIERFTVKEFKHRYCQTEDFETAFVNYINNLSDGDDLIDPSHIREGVCVRVESGRSLKVYKNKGHNFKVAEGLVKDSGVVDMEEVESLS